MQEFFCSKRNITLLIENCIECFKKDRSGYSDQNLCMAYNLVTKNIEEVENDIK